MRQRTLTIMLTMLMSMVVSLVCADEHEYVDLGLPSGTLWATCNVGANSPEEYGDYFAWGETAQKSAYTWGAYKWCNGTETTLTKYCYDSNYGNNGFTDTLNELELTDDAAYMNWGTEWCMPDKNQWEELFNACDWTLTTRSGVNGYEIKSKSNNNSIFLPEAGWVRESGYTMKEKRGCYWSKSLIDSSESDIECRKAWYMSFYSDSERIGVGKSWRLYGHSIRPIYNKISVTNIALNHETYTLEGVGKTFQLEVTVLPENATNKEVTWKSFNESVCFVTNGLVIATGYGTTLVMATTVDGGFIAYCAITVTDETPVTDIEADKTDSQTYDLSGREVTKPKKGIYIKDGKKMIAK